MAGETSSYFQDDSMYQILQREWGWIPHLRRLMNRRDLLPQAFYKGFSSIHWRICFLNFATLAIKYHHMTIWGTCSHHIEITCLPSMFYQLVHWFIPPQSPFPLTVLFSFFPSSPFILQYSSHCLSLFILLSFYYYFLNKIFFLAWYWMKLWSGWTLHLLWLVQQLKFYLLINRTQTTADKKSDIKHILSSNVVLLCILSYLEINLSTYNESRHIKKILRLFQQNSWNLLEFLTMTAK